jgi:hypothetical protein
MSYFNHSYQKAFPVTAGNGLVAGVNLANGFITDTGIPTSQLRAIGDAAGPGTSNPAIGLFNKDTYLSVDGASVEVTQGQSLILAGSSVKRHDKQGPFHGGYAESNKSKYMNPKYVVNAYKFLAAQPEQSIVHIGVTNFQAGTTLSITTAGVNCAADGVYTNVPTTNGSGTGLTVDIEVLGGVVVSVVENQVGSGYIATDVVTLDTSSDPALDCDTDPTFTVDSYGTQDCEFTFLCGETYNLFINLSGNPVLRVLNHDSYRKLAAYTGCCPDEAIEPTPVDSTLVFIDWAQQIITSPYLLHFVRPIVFDQEGNPWFATADEATAEGWPATQIWDNYTSTGYTEGALAGIRLIGAYIDTQFETCSFQVSDYFEKDIVKMDITLSDEEGNPCDFNGLCVTTECCGFNGQGFGDTYLKEIIQYEAYLQNCFSSDSRIREVNQGVYLRDILNRFAFFDKYVIQHVVPRWNNHSSQLDDEQYSLCMYVPAGTDMTAFEGVIGTWLTAAGNPLGADILVNGVAGEFNLEGGAHVPCPVTALPTAP